MINRHTAGDIFENLLSIAGTANSVDVTDIDDLRKEADEFFQRISTMSDWSQLLKMIEKSYEMKMLISGMLGIIPKYAAIDEDLNKLFDEGVDLLSYIVGGDLGGFRILRDTYAEKAGEGKDS